MLVVVEVLFLGTTGRVGTLSSFACFGVSLLISPFWLVSSLLVLLLVAGGLGFKFRKVVISGGDGSLVAVASCSVGATGGLGFPLAVEVSRGATGGVDALAFSVDFDVSISVRSLVVSLGLTLLVVEEVRPLGATGGFGSNVGALALTAGFGVSVAVRMSLMVVPCWPGSGMLGLLLVAGGLGSIVGLVALTGGLCCLVVARVFLTLLMGGHGVGVSSEDGDVSVVSGGGDLSVGLQGVALSVVLGGVGILVSVEVGSSVVTGDSG